MTRIYNITQYTNDDSVYVLFEGCNFQCKGCIRKLMKYDPHLSVDTKNHLETTVNSEHLSLDEFEKIASRLGVKKATLGGGEPTLDPELPDIVDILESLSIKTLLLTNGHCLDRKLIVELEEAGLSGAQISIKAIDEAIHRLYTGQTNRQVLENFRGLAKTSIKLIAESILIPGLVEADEIERIAEFISTVNPAIPYRIDVFVPVGGASWRQPMTKELVEAVQTAKKHLLIVTYLSYEEGHGMTESINVYPQIKDL